MPLDPITAILNIGGQIIDKIFPSKDEAEKAKLKMADLAMQGQLEQIKLLVNQMQINLEEAKSQRLWVSGWRPFVGWVCGSALAWHYIFMPFLVWLLEAFGRSTNMPALDISELMTILIGILGLGAYRTFEKIKSVS